MELQTQETQQELFRQFSEKPKKPERLPSLSRGPKPILLNTTAEQVLFWTILLILGLCLVFFLGVLRGRSTSVPTTKVPVAIPAPKPSMPAFAMASQNAPVPPLTVLSNKPYTIQLVTYKRQSLADEDVSKLKRQGHTAFIIPSGDYFQVCAGQYTNKEEAKKDLATFSIRYKDCFLRRH